MRHPRTLQCCKFDCVTERYIIKGENVV
jgi:hypothetical protein